MAHFAKNQTHEKVPLLGACTSKERSEAHASRVLRALALRLGNNLEGVVQLV